MILSVASACTFVGTGGESLAASFVLCFFFPHDKRLGSMLCFRFVPRELDVLQINFERRLG